MNFGSSSRFGSHHVRLESTSEQAPDGGKDQRWPTFIRNQAPGIVACDCFVSVTVCCRILYVFVALEIGSRPLLHLNVTEHPTSEWTLQQLREALPGDQNYRFLLHDRHKTFSLMWMKRSRVRASTYCYHRFVCPPPTLIAND